MISSCLGKNDPLQTEAVISPLKIMEAFPYLIVDNTIIQFVEDHIHLGITFTDKPIILKRDYIYNIYMLFK